ncbi:acireductone synthase [Uliginosibacterium gangwonense]|uniref:acireductone synthase n=1 Tax=Uliginosibacterium gangwonense TaxID=392736 RepID=UPI000376C6A3|nr:acireductone synthase [Uliginosibacterium gangwonense]
MAIEQKVCLAGVQAIVTDIEGTTTPIAFVQETLFPYAREHLAAFVTAHQHTEAIQSILREVSAIAVRSLSVEDAVDLLALWAQEDLKITPLKTLQGLIWREGYGTGALRGPVYEDAAASLQAWKQARFQLYVYSSGSVAAQQLLFGHSNQGDLRRLFSGWFDTKQGSKLESDSYRRIAADIGIPTQAIAFLSDHPRELQAADSAGWQTVRLLRTQDLTISSSPARIPVDPGISTVSSFAQIELVST